MLYDKHQETDPFMESWQLLSYPADSSHFIKPYIHYRVQNGPLLDRIMSQIKPVHTLHRRSGFPKDVFFFFFFFLDVPFRYFSSQAAVAGYM